MWACKDNPQGVFTGYIIKLIKYWLVGSYLVIKSTPRVPCGRPIVAIGYKYNSRKVLGFIATKGDGSTEPGDLYLSLFTDIYYNVSVRPIIYPQMLDRYFNACNSIYKISRIQQSDLAQDKYGVTQSGDFRLATTVALGMGITDGKLLFCHRISKESLDKKIQTREYNSRTIYYCFNNIFPDDCGSSYLNLSPITIDDIPRPHKISHYTSDVLPSTISVAYENFVSTLTTPYDLPRNILLPSDYPNHFHAMKKY